MKIHFNTHIKNTNERARYDKSMDMVRKLAFEQMLKSMINSSKNINTEKRIYNDILVENIVSAISNR